MAWDGSRLALRGHAEDLPLREDLRCEQQARPFARLEKGVSPPQLALDADAQVDFVLPAQILDTGRVDSSDRRGACEGFGAGLWWWVPAVSGTPHQASYADLFSGTALVQIWGQTLQGLGRNLVRYNVGGFRNHRPLPTVQLWAMRIDNSWLDRASADRNSTRNECMIDARLCNVLDTPRTRGVTVEFVSRAPKQRTMDTRSSAGGNLQAWNRPDRAPYPSNEVQQVRTRWGVWR